MLPLIVAAIGAASAIAGVLTTKAANEKDRQAVKRYEKVNAELINSRDRLQKRYEELSAQSTAQISDLNRKLAQSEMEKDALYIAVRSQNELIYLMEIINQNPSLEILVKFKQAVILTNHVLKQLGENLVPISQDYFSRTLANVDRANDYSKEQLYDFMAVLMNPEQDTITSLLGKIENEIVKPIIEVKQQDLAFDNSEAQNLSKQIQKMIEQEQYEEALIYINKAIAIDRNNDEFWYYKSLVFNCLGKNKHQALDLIDKAIELNPYEGIYFYQQSYCLSNIGLNNEALKSINKAIHLQSDDEVLYSLYEKSNLLCSFEEYEEALILVNQSIELDPNEFLFLEHKGYILYHLGEYNEALIFLDKAIELEAESDSAWFIRGLVLSHTKAWLFFDRKDEALESFNKAININPNNSEYLKFKDEIMK
jgi:tetratricopeptide (TPR) repeat protein